ncbi:MAG: hypothetical protein F6J93_34440 [Oscillatoria sp. SIO1A7]|nr:hypothetical protein [Oscillatoria sp. SIO1A7]
MGLKIKKGMLEKAVLNPARKSFKNVVYRLYEENKAVIEDPYEFADIGLTNHDIVWTGRLRDSQTMTIRHDSDSSLASIKWDPVSPETGERYAMKVFVGFFGWSGRYYPGRDWPDRAVRRSDPENVFESYF